jgi:hypothetical protein
MIRRFFLGLFYLNFGSSFHSYAYVHFQKCCVIISLLTPCLKSRYYFFCIPFLLLLIKSVQPESVMVYSVRKLDAANSSSGSWDATCQEKPTTHAKTRQELYVVRPILPTSTEHTRYITISL